MRAYWPWLSGMVAVPLVWAFGPNYRTYPYWVTVTLFGLSCAAAWWPWLAKDAPYSFWLVAIALFFATLAIAAAVAVLVLDQT
jgi:hypothetical protein